MLAAAVPPARAPISGRTTIITATGYRKVTPNTSEGRLAAMALMLLGPAASAPSPPATPDTR
jgi:hypothetical protein